MQVNIDPQKCNVTPRMQGIWKRAPESWAAHVCGYGMAKLTYEMVGNLNALNKMVSLDILEKLKLLEKETIFPTSGGFNYGRFFDRYAIEADISLFEDYETLSKFGFNEFKECLEDMFQPDADHYRSFFGRGEFPFIEVGEIKRTDGNNIIVYFLSR